MGARVLRQTNKHKIDLHRLKHEDARRTIIHFIEDHWLENAELEIITGNSSKMRTLVIDILTEYKLKYQVGRRFDLHNSGYVVTWTT